MKSLADYLVVTGDEIENTPKSAVITVVLVIGCITASLME